MKLAIILTLLGCSLVLDFAGAPKALAAPPMSGREFRDCPECPRMTRLPGGSFRMGDDHAPAKADEQPVHAVAVPAFAAGTFEVTRGEFAAFVAATGYAPAPGCLTGRNPIVIGQRPARWSFEPAASWRDPGYPANDDMPVTCVAWADADAYAAWLSKRAGHPYRLLSEAEFEYAIRAGTSTEYWWGDDPDQLCAYANGGDLSAQKAFPTWPAAKCDDGYAFTARVGSYRPNPFGLYDMAGNAWEWTADCYAPTYDPQPRDGSAYTGGSCEHRVLRGGSMGWGVVDLRSSQRNGLLPPAIRGGDIGFRVARSL